jgi:hypothetical protein
MVRDFGRISLTGDDCSQMILNEEELHLAGLGEPD